jgi:hypothetical protein
VVVSAHWVATFDWLATLLGVGRAMAQDAPGIAGRQFGRYEQSSASGNAVLLAGADILRQVQ